MSISAGPNNYVFYDEEDYFQPEKVRLQSLKDILKLLDLNGCSLYLGIYLVLTVEDKAMFFFRSIFFFKLNKEFLPRLKK